MIKDNERSEIKSSLSKYKSKISLNREKLKTNLDLKLSGSPVAEHQSTQKPPKPKLKNKSKKVDYKKQLREIEAKLQQNKGDQELKRIGKLMSK